MKAGPHDDSLDAFGKEETPPSLVEWPVGQDSLAAFPPEPGDIERQYLRATAAAPRLPSARGFRAPVAVAALAVVGAVTIVVLNVLSDRSTPRVRESFIAEAKPEPAAPTAELPPTREPQGELAPPPEVSRTSEISRTPETPQRPTATRQTEPVPPSTPRPDSADRLARRSPPLPEPTPSPTRRAVDESSRTPAPLTTAKPLDLPVPASVSALAERVDDAPQPPAAPAPAATTGVSPVQTAASIARAESAPLAAPPPALPAPTPTPPPVAAAARPSAPAVVTPTVLIETVLSRYESAFNALDASRAKAVWPTVNERSLDRAFDSLEQQQFDLGACDIKVTAPKAIASCDGTARYTPKVGNRKMRVERRQWTFRLEANGETWSIASVDSR